MTEETTPPPIDDPTRPFSDTITFQTGSGSFPAPHLPEHIGRYRIVGLIGQGGMGAVYEAVQDKPDRKVALKVVRPGMVSAEALRRFELETELLGKLQHPGIAQIYEAGTADTGQGPQPYFAMELVRGRTLGEHVRGEDLSLRRKLDLAAKVCDAVQHAHQKGIIHRDLKPGNILIDESGQPKILDFGVARATESDRQATLRTDIGQIVGTLPYMSPEQVGGDPGELDTRSDVYALGVILYEMLAGRLPYHVHGRTLAEALRTICTEEPASLGTLDRALRGDVATIVDKALSKERDRRYTSAAELASDLRHYLADEPIQARPPSASYQIAKFARRNKVLVGGAAGIVLALLAGIVAASWQAARARREAHKAEAVNAFVRTMLAAANPHSLSRSDPEHGRTVTVIQALDAAVKKLDGGELRREPLVDAAVRQTIGETFRDLGAYAAAESNLDEALETRRRLLRDDDPEVAESLDGLAQLRVIQERKEEAESLFRQAIAIWKGRPDIRSAGYASSMNGLAELLADGGKSEEADRIFRAALDWERGHLAAGHAESSRTRNSLAALLHARGKLAEAEALFEETLALRRRHLGSHHPDVASTLYQLALLQQDQGNAAGAVASMREAVGIWRRVLGNNHSFVATSLATLGAMLRDQGKLAEAEPLLVESAAIQRQALGEGHPQLAGILYNLAKLLQAEGKPAQAEPVAREALEIMTRSLPPDHPMLAASMAGLGSILTDAGRPSEAEPLLRRALAIEEKVLPEGDWQRSQVRSLLGAALLGQKRYAEAEPHLLEGYDGLSRSTSVPPDRKRLALERLVRLYENWNTAEPSSARSERLGSWRAALAALAP